MEKKCNDAKRTHCGSDAACSCDVHQRSSFSQQKRIIGERTANFIDNTERELAERVEAVHVNSFQIPGPSSTIERCVQFNNIQQNLFFNNYIASYHRQQSLGGGYYRSYSDTSVINEQTNFNNNCGITDDVDDSVEMKRSRSGRIVAVRQQPLSVLRSWESTNLGRMLNRMKGGRLPGAYFKVMSYNVLAQDLLDDHPELYKGNDRRALGWDIRWKNLYNEIKEHDCDIMCLQEIQKSHIDQYYAKLSSLGYSILYKQRTGPRTDGCAIYYKTDKFNLVEHTFVEYKQPNVSLLDRDNIAVIATFSPKENPSAQFIVATTHLLYNPKRQDVRLAQTQVLLTEVERYAYRKRENGNEFYQPIIITGDFNSTPSSATYRFIVNGRYDYENVMLRARYKTGKVLIPNSLYITDNCQHADLIEKRKENVTVTRSEEIKIIKLHSSDRNKPIERGKANHEKHVFSSGSLSHNFNFQSVYRHSLNGDLEGTTYQDEWVTVDYIFYSGSDGKEASSPKMSKLQLLSKYSLPTKRQLSNVRIPNFEVGSDHLALIAKFKLEY